MNIVDTFFDVNKIIVQYLKKDENKRIRKILFYFLLILCLVSFGILIFSPYELKEEFIQFLFIFVGVNAYLWLLVLISYADFKSPNELLNENLQEIKVEREKLIEKIGDDSVASTIKLSLNQLSGYYAVNLDQARNSYRWSILSIILGLITIIVGIWIIYFSQNPNLTIGIITGFSGVIIEFIGASNLYIYNKTLSQLNIYFKELVKIQDTMLAVELCDKIDDNNPKKIEIIEKIIIELISKK